MKGIFDHADHFLSFWNLTDFCLIKLNQNVLQIWWYYTCTRIYYNMMVVVAGLLLVSSDWADQHSWGRQQMVPDGPRGLPYRLVKYDGTTYVPECITNLMVLHMYQNVLVLVVSALWRITPSLRWYNRSLWRARRYYSWKASPLFYRTSFMAGVYVFKVY